MLAAVDFAQQQTRERISGVGDSGQARDQRTDREVAGRTAVTDFIVGAGTKLGAELEARAFPGPGNRIQQLLVDDRGLESEDRGRDFRALRSRNRESRKCGVADARQTDRRRQDFPYIPGRVSMNLRRR